MNTISIPGNNKNSSSTVFASFNKTTQCHDGLSYNEAHSFYAFQTCTTNAAYIISFLLIFDRWIQNQFLEIIRTLLLLSLLASTKLFSVIMVFEAHSFYAFQTRTANVAYIISFPFNLWLLNTESIPGNYKNSSSTVFVTSNKTIQCHHGLSYAEAHISCVLQTRTATAAYRIFFAFLCAIEYRINYQ